ncbi:uncharacterized protein ACOB8E_001910 isoform 2-T2 [Sarcophilus harrisii]
MNSSPRSCFQGTRTAIIHLEEEARRNYKSIPDGYYLRESLRLDIWTLEKEDGENNTDGSFPKSLDHLTRSDSFSL